MAPRRAPTARHLAGAGVAATLTQHANAQLDRLMPPPSLPGLPDPPVLQNALFENPIPIVIAALALGLALYAFALRRNGRRTGILAALIAAAAGVVALGISIAVETDRERLIRETRELVAAVATAHGPALDRLLTADARLAVPGAGPGWTKAEITSWIEERLAPGSPFAIQDYSVSDVQADVPRSNLGNTRATVNVTPVSQGGPTRFVCMLTWRKSSTGAWSVVEIEPLWLQGWGEITANDMRRGTLR